MRFFCLSLLLLLGVTVVSHAAKTPNVVIIFMDDMGYADVGCFGAEGYQTPNMDRLAKEGRKFTNFHVPQPVCSASRAAILTGCYPNRIGMHGALSPKATHGLHADEVTLAELMKGKGYATAAVGKWHLGHLPPFLPTKHGFDEYYGLPYSNDMWPHHPQAKPGAYPKLPLYKNEQIVDEEITPEDQKSLTRNYTRHAVDFIQRSKDNPFFLYLAHSMPHVPLFVGADFEGKSKRGIYADVMAELDWSVGQVVAALEKQGVKDNTWIILTSDNGPWLSYGTHSGSAGKLREGKGTVWEGGVRVSCLMSWPGHIPAGTTSEAMLMTIDLLPTVASALSAELPPKAIDGKNVWPLIAGEKEAKNPHDFYAYYYHQNELQALVSGDGRWKWILPHTYRALGTQPRAEGGIPVKYESRKIQEPELYDLANDPGETLNVAAKNPEIVARMEERAALIRKELGDKLMDLPQGAGSREAGQIGD